ERRQEPQPGKIENGIKPQGAERKELPQRMGQRQCYDTHGPAAAAGTHDLKRVAQKRLEPRKRPARVVVRRTVERIQKRRRQVKNAAGLEDPADLARDKLWLRQVLE